MDGALTLAGLDPDRTPLHRWLGAVWAAVVQLAGQGVDLEKVWAPFHADPADHGSPDRETWGALPEHQVATQRLLDAMPKAGS